MSEPFTPAAKFRQSLAAGADFPDAVHSRALLDPALPAVLGNSQPFGELVATAAAMYCFGRKAMPIETSVDTGLAAIRPAGRGTAGVQRRRERAEGIAVDHLPDGRAFAVGTTSVLLLCLRWREGTSVLTLPAACPRLQNVSNSLRGLDTRIVTAVAGALCLLVAPDGSSVHTHFVHHLRSDATNGR